MNDFLIALQFLTRIPVPLKIEWNDENVANSLLYYPIVGVLIGALLVFIVSVLSTDKNEMLIAALVLAAWVVITGGLHLDGLADSADAWVGSQGDKQRALEIMKDPQAGPIAVVVLIVVLLIKFSAIYSLLINQMEYGLLILSLVLGRSVPLVLFVNTPYVRAQGLGSAMVNYFPHKKVKAVLGFVAVTSVLFMGLVNGVILLLLCAITIWILRSLMMKQLEGMTGDTIGAAIEIIETLVLCVIVFSR